ncbi:MAG: OmpA family protein [Bdellovibrionaceae bacterium]|nr:OmpA family protein [Pseudobdellovibrionaceae bacterium]
MKHLLLFILVSGFSIFSNADDNYDLTGRWGVGLGLGMNSVVGPEVFKSGAGELDSKLSGALWGRYHLTDRIGFELAYTRLAYEFKTGGTNLDPMTDMLDLSAAYRMWPTKRFHILFQLGVGYVRATDFSAVAPDDKRDDFVLKARMGLEYMITNNIMLALQGDYYKINLGGGNDPELRVLAPMLAATYYFGASKTAPADTDGDGIADADDKCPGTAAGSNVGSDGCVLAEKKVDTDGDGIADIDDKCPGTTAGQAVNEFGCAKTEKLEITLNVQFNPGSSVIDPKFVGDLEKFGEFLKQYPDTKAEIEGHTDNTGAEKLNFAISQKRAQAVVNSLVKNYGIDKKRLTAKGYGPSQPVADNTTPDGRTKNRRVVAHVQTTK